jgi:hypothetical protein
MRTTSHYPKAVTSLKTFYLQKVLVIELHNYVTSSSAAIRLLLRRTLRGSEHY